MPNPFDADTIQPEENEDTITLEDLVGEGRKYKDPNELAKAYNHADSYIQNLKAEKARVEAEAKVLRDLVEARGKAPEDSKNDPPAARIEPPEPQNRDQQVDLNELVRKELSAAREQESAAANINRAAEVMSNHYGSAHKAQEAIRVRAQELGVSFDWLKDSAAKSPAAFFATMGINANQRPVNTPGYTPEVNLGHKGGSAKNFRYFEEIRKADVKLYNSPEIRKQMFESARDLGDKFYAS